MNAREIVKKLSEEYPGKTIIQIPQDEPSEIICEVEPANKHPKYSVAVAVIDESAPHYNRETETYEILLGKLMLKVGGQEVALEEGDTYIIQPGIVHSARADAAWIKVTTEPGWTPEGHVLVEK